MNKNFFLFLATTKCRQQQWKEAPLTQGEGQEKRATRQEIGEQP